MLKIFILGSKFRLSLMFINMHEIPFQIDFFIKAIEANSFDIALYLLNLNEDEICQDPGPVTIAIVNSFKLNKQYLKSKIFVLKRLMSIFNFMQTKQVLDIIAVQIKDTSLENNLFVHSCNPLLNMCLLFEII